MTIVDVHSHMGQYASARMSADGARLNGLFEEAGIAHGVVFSIEACYGAIDLGNAYTIHEVAAHHSLSAMIVAHPEHLESSARWIREGALNPDVVGVKLHPSLGNYDLGAGVMRLIEEHIGPAGFPVLSHVGNDSPNVTIDKYLELAARFPGIYFIAAHLGVGILGVSDAAVNAWTRRPQPNVWFDVGTLRALCCGAVEHLLDVTGPDRLCFGTDAPLYHPSPFVRMLEILDVSEEVREKIACRNALTALPRLRLKSKEAL